MPSLRYLGFLLVFFLALSPIPARADHVVWFNPTGVKLVGSGTIGSASTPLALRVQPTGGGAPQSGALYLPLSLGTDVVVDSVLLCYRTTSSDFSARITGITLQSLTLPGVATAVWSDGSVHTSIPGECLALDVPDVAPGGAPGLQINYVVEPLTYLEIGAVGLKVKTPMVSSADGFEEFGTAPARLLSRPNPFERSARIDFRVADPGEVSLRIHDASGRLVRTLVSRDFPVGEYSETWDGRDDRGVEAPAGIYFTRLTTRRGSATGRVTLLR